MVFIMLYINEVEEFVFICFVNEGLGDENIDILVVNNINMFGFYFIMSSFVLSFVIEMENIWVCKYMFNFLVSIVGSEEMVDLSGLEYFIDL